MVASPPAPLQGAMEFLLLADAHEEAFKVAMRYGHLEAFLAMLGDEMQPQDLARVAQVQPW